MSERRRIKYVDYDGPTGPGWVATGKGFIRLEDGGAALLAESAMGVDRMLSHTEDGPEPAAGLLCPRCGSHGSVEKKLSDEDVFFCLRKTCTFAGPIRDASSQPDEGLDPAS